MSNHNHTNVITMYYTHFCLEIILILTFHMETYFTYYNILGHLNDRSGRKNRASLIYLIQLHSYTDT